jgi:hypothetical protein
LVLEGEGEAFLKKWPNKAIVSFEKFPVMSKAQTHMHTHTHPCLSPPHNTMHTGKDEEAPVISPSVPENRRRLLRREGI